ncbi:MAG: MFS transporter [Geminicoccaceae bacterium]|nr:MFS transporter [Geminicoccaceae bacterium]
MLLFLNVAHFLDHFFLLIFPTAVLALGVAWSMPYGEVLALGTPAFAVFALATLPVGWLGDRVSKTTLMTVFFIGIGGSSILVGLAPGPLSLAAALALLGLFAAIYHPVATALVVQYATRRGAALGVNGVFGNLGVAGAPLVTGALCTFVGWRSAFILPGVIAILIGIAFMLGPARAPLRNMTADAAPQPPPAPARAQVRVFTIVALSALFGGIVFNGITVSLPKVFEERLAGLASSVGEVGAAASIVFLIASFAQIWVGRLLDRIGARPILVGCALLQTLLFVALVEAEGPILFALAIPLMLVVFGEIPVGAWLVGHYAAPGWRSRIYGVQYLLALGVSAGVVPLIAVLHRTGGGFGSMFLLLAGAALVVTVAACFLPRLESAAEAPRPLAARVPAE